MIKKKISPAVIGRLPRYYRFLSDVEKAGKIRTSSKEISEKLGFTASQIRQDFNCFGGFGQQGYGYNVHQLKEEIGLALGLKVRKNTIVIGAGNIARAILNDVDFKKNGFDLVAVFDKNPALTGQLVKGLPIRHIDMLDEFCRESSPKVAVLCVPKEDAPEMVRQLVKLGITGLWNFSHYDVSSVFTGISVENVHLTDSLMTLCYKVSEN